MKKIVSIALSVFAFMALSTEVFSQQANQQIKMNAQNKDSSSPSPVRMNSLSADVQVMGNIAITTVDMVFCNDTDRVLEGEFEFPLGAGESIIGYALDINGKMRQGVVVEKDKGRQVFEAVVRQGIDPGLVEMTSGNSFKTRVYPIPAKGSRKVQITYQGELKNSSSDGKAYVFSALSSEVLENFDFKITVLDKKKTSDDSSNASISDSNVIKFDDLDSGYTAQFSKKNYSLTKPVSVIIPSRYSSLQANASDGTVFMQDIGKETFFYYYMPLETKSVAKKLPQHLAVYYDVSASASKRNFVAEMAFLLQYIEKLTNPTVTLIPFSNALHEAKEFSGSAENIMGGVFDYIQDCNFDGATDLNYDFASMYKADEVLIFTDGISNWNASANKDDGKNTGKNTSKNNTVVNTINSSAVADFVWLENTARENGGVCINLDAGDISSSFKNRLKVVTLKKFDFSGAVDSLINEPFRLIRAEYDKNALSDVFPLDGTVVGSDFSLTGKLSRKQGEVTLCFGHGTQVEKTVKVLVSAVDGMYSDNVARLWASDKIAALGSDYDANRQEIIELSKKFGIVTKDTSLIVLDSVQDYVRYGIVPPEELRKEYDRIVSRQSGGVKTSDDSKGTIPASVYTKFEEFRKWWNTDIKEFKKKKPGKGEEPIPVPRPPIHIMNSDADVDLMEVTDSASVLDEAPSMSAPRGSARMRANSMSREMVSEPASLAKSAVGNAKGGAAIQLQAWSPNANYLSVLKRTPVASMYAKYMELKNQYASSPAFYMEVSDYFAEEGLAAESLRILSNLAELELENSDILRALGNKLIERELFVLAVPVFEKLVKMRSEIPQFYRDLGMAYYYAGESQKAVDTLYSVAYKTWDGRFAEIQQIALNDMNAIIAAEDGKIDVSAIDKKLIQNFDIDVRVVLTWNTDNCDIDLWVTDADGEKCFYGNRITANGARMSRDFTQGYGPEEFCIRKAPDGKLKIEANYYGNHQQKLLQPVTVQAEVYTDFGRATQKRQVLTLQLDSVKQTFFIGEVE